MYKLPIDKSLIMWYNWSGAHDQGARNFHYIILLAFCQVKSRTILHKYFIPNLCIIPSCNLWGCMVYYHCQEGIPASRLKAGSRAEGFKSHRGRSEKIWKNLLTNPLECGTIRMSRGRQERTTSPQCVVG